MNYNFFVPTRVLFGAGQLSHLHEQAMPGKKAMVVISNGKSTRENGSLDRTLNELHQAGVETVLFDKVGANPLKSVVEEGGRGMRKDMVNRLLLIRIRLKVHGSHLDLGGHARKPAPVSSRGSHRP